MKTLKLSDDEMLTIAIGLDEMDNTGMWSDDLPKKKVNRIYTAMNSLRSKIELVPDKQDSAEVIFEKVKNKLKHKDLKRFTFLVDEHGQIGVQFQSPMGRMSYGCRTHNPKEIKEELIEYISSMIKQFR